MKAFSIAFLTATLCLGGCSKGVSKVDAAPSPAAAVNAPAFSADSAYSYVAAQTAMGPRAPRTEGHAKCAAYIATELRRHGADTVVEQRTDLEGFGPMVNIMGRYNLQADRRILLLAHWDTRPWADQDPDPANHSKAIDGANDGASGVGVLLELARLMGVQRPDVGVDLLLVDAEDSGTEDDDDSWARGTQYFVENMPYGVAEAMPSCAVLLDMVGGRDAKFPREMISNQNARGITDRIWALAAANGLGRRFPDRTGGAVNDDHVPLLRAGIPAVDIIETNHPQSGAFNPTWHTMADNLDNIDKNTLGDVGRLVTLLVYSEK